MAYRQNYITDGQNFITSNNKQFTVLSDGRLFILHPVIDGEIDTTEDIYPQTIVDNIKGLNDNVPFKLIFTNILVSTWVSDATYLDYAYRASIELAGVTSNSFAQVIYSVADASSGEYAPVSETYDGGIYLYSKSDIPITIPTIYVLK